MDKQKQIEEMAHNLCLNERDCEDCERNGVCLAYSTATIIYNAGYRKIPEGAVVLTKFEYDEMLADVTASKKKLARIIDSAKSKGQKETAKEILNTVKELHTENTGEEFGCDWLGTQLIKLAQRYGVEVE